MSGKIRDDLTLAACAISLGYKIGNLTSAHFVAGIPQNGLQFERGDVHVWETSRGWRVAKLKEGKFPPAEAGDFHRNLLTALENGAEL
jgi:hypothetical protein